MFGADVLRNVRTFYMVFMVAPGVWVRFPFHHNFKSNH
nr:MAG TPA: hypothetical protein [Caudoviricetes sp.]